MKKILIPTVMIVVVLVIGIAGVFALTSEPEAYVPNAYINSVSGSVEIKTPGSDWSPVSVNTKLFEGDSIKTGSNSEAELIFFDNSSSRIAENTEITLAELFIDPKNTENQKVGIQVFGGRVWSRIIKLLDRNAEFAVMSSSTVATVRGTALDFEVTDIGTTILVDDSVVEVAAVASEETIDKLTGNKTIDIKKELAKINVTEGNEVEVLVDKLPEFSEEFNLQDARKKIENTPWLQENKLQDLQFMDNIEKKTLNRLEKTAGPLPGSALYGLKKAAENVRSVITFNPEKKQELELQFIRRRAIEGVVLQATGKIEEGGVLFQEFKQQLETKASELEKLPPKIKERIGKELRALEIETKALPKRLPIIEEINLPRDLPRFDDVKEEFEGLKNELLRQAEEERLTPEELEARLKELEKKAIEERYRIEGEEEGAIKEERPIIKEEVKEILEEPILSDEPVKEIIETIKDLPIPISLRIKTPRLNIDAGATLQLSAIVIFDNGSTKEVTSDITWNVSGDPGASVSPSGFLTTPPDGGKFIITASHTAVNGQKFSDSVIITALPLVQF